MKKYVLILMVFVANTVYAQWYGSYIPYIPYTGNAYVNAQLMASEYRLMQETYKMQQAINNSIQQMGQQVQREIQSMSYVPVEPNGHYERVSQTCPDCGGSRKRIKTLYGGSSGNRDVALTCTRCHGTGSIKVSQ